MKKRESRVKTTAAGSVIKSRTDYYHPMVPNENGAKHHPSPSFSNKPKGNKPKITTNPRRTAVRSGTGTKARSG